MKGGRGEKWNPDSGTNTQMTFGAVRENESSPRIMLLDKLIGNKLVRRGNRI